MSAKLLIKGGCVLTMGTKTTNLPTGDVLIENGQIAEVAPAIRTRGAEIIDASDTIVMPGFVDTHRHTWHSLFRHAGRSDPALPSLIGPHLSPEHVYAATLIGLLGALEAGITTVVDWVDLPAEPAIQDASLQAHADAGSRTVFVAAPAEWAAEAPDADRTATLNTGPATTPAFGPLLRQPDTWDRARRAGLRIHAHAGPGRDSRTVVAGLGDAGLLGPDVTLVHCTDLDDRDIEAISSSGAHVSVAPAVEMTDGFGWPKLQAFIDRGIRPGLAIGSELEAPGDMFAQMRAANSVQHATLFDLKLAGKAGVPNLLTTRDVIRHGTIDGAHTAGLGGTTGSVVAGMQADIVVLRTDRPNIFPVNDPIGAVVWGMDTSNIDVVLIGGKVLVRDGALVADVAGPRRLAQDAQRAIAAAAGLQVGMGSQ